MRKEAEDWIYEAVVYAMLRTWCSHKWRETFWMAGLLLASFKWLFCVGMMALGRSPSVFPTRSVPRLPPANISFLYQRGWVMLATDSVLKQDTKEVALSSELSVLGFFGGNVLCTVTLRHTNCILFICSSPLLIMKETACIVRRWRYVYKCVVFFGIFNP